MLIIFVNLIKYVIYYYYSLESGHFFLRRYDGKGLLLTSQSNMGAWVGIPPHKKLTFVI